jgi:hypothetical protein
VEAVALDGANQEHLVAVVVVVVARMVGKVALDSTMVLLGLIPQEI